MSRNVLFVSVLLVACVVAATAQTDTRIDGVVQPFISSQKIPAAGVAVVRDGKVVVAKGYGAADLDAGTPVTENTGFQIASVTKQFTAAGIMLLVEQGKLKLDDQLSKFLSDVPPTWKVVTIRQLLNQISGIPNYTAGGKLVNDKVYTGSEILGLVRDLPVDFEPGTKWAYSNTNYFLLGQVIEKVSGKSYPEFMRARVFKPLGMTSTVVNTSGLQLQNAAVGYSHPKGKWQKAKLDDPSQPFAAGAIVSTAADMAKWALAVNEGSLLKKSSWDEAFATGKLTDGKPTGYGFGWRLGKIGAVDYLGHSGGISGFSSYHLRFPAEKLSVVVLVNTTSGAPEDLAFQIAGLYLPNVATALAAKDAAKNVAPIADSDPETTKFLLGVFEGMLRGEGDAALFSAEMQKVMFPDAIKQLKGPLGGEVLKSFDLLTAENAEGTKRRLYRGTFESGLKVRATFALDAQGKITAANVRPE